MVREDILGCLLGSVLGISLLFFLIYRNPAVLFFVLLPLGVGLQLALGVMAIACSQIHLLATAFATVVLGLGVDFAIHVYDRHTMEKQAGASTGLAVEKAVVNTGTAVVAGCLTTLTAFLVLTLTESPILQQIAWMVSLGLFFCLVTILLALPAGLAWLDKRSIKKPKRSMLLLGTDKLGTLVSTYPKTCLVFSIVFVLGSLPGVLQLRFEKDMSALRPQGLEALDVQEDLLQTFGGGRQYALVSWVAKDIESFWEEGRRADDILQKLKASHIVQSWSSLGQLSSERPPLIKEMDMDAIRRLFGKYGLSLEKFRETNGFLEAVSGIAGSAREESNVKAVRTAREDLNMLPDMFKRFFICEKDLIRGIAWIMVPGKKEAQMLRDALKESAGKLCVVNPELAVDALVNEVRNELGMTLGVAALLIIGILMVFFKRMSILPFVLMPALMGLFVTAGIMGWANINLNPFNFIVLPILIGIGLDDGIHIYRRYQELGEIKQTLATTGRSVLVTTLTTVCGFGSLSIANYHVLESMGVMAIVGVVACFVFSVMTLPAILVIRDRRGTRP